MISLEKTMNTPLPEFQKPIDPKRYAIASIIGLVGAFTIADMMGHMISAATRTIQMDKDYREAVSQCHEAAKAESTLEAYEISYEDCMKAKFPPQMGGPLR